MAQFASKPHEDVSYHETWSSECRVPEAQRPFGDVRSAKLACEECNGTFVNPVLVAARENYDPTDPFAWAVGWLAAIIYADCDTPGGDAAPYRVVHAQTGQGSDLHGVTEDHLRHAIRVFSLAASMAGGAGR